MIKMILYYLCKENMAQKQTFKGLIVKINDNESLTDISTWENVLSKDIHEADIIIVKYNDFLGFECQEVVKNRFIR